jgi:outer membrane immunogenic protein
MKRILLGALAVSFAVTAASQIAFAADKAVHKKAPIFTKAPAAIPFSWTGFYFGGFAGGAGTGSVSTPDATNPATVTVGALTFLPGTPSFCDGGTPGLKTGCVATYGLGTSVIGGGTAGYNWQFNKTVIGLEGEYGYLHLSGSGLMPFIAGAPCGTAANPCITTMSTTLGNWYGSITGRLGVTADAVNPAWSDHLLLYGKAGAAVTRASTSEVILPSALAFAPTPGNTWAASKDIWGVAAGVGAEWALTRNWSTKVEYEYLGFNGSVQACAILPLGASGAGGVWCTQTSINGVHTGKFGVNYHL